MFRLDAKLKVYLHREAVDFRKSINLGSAAAGGTPNGYSQRLALYGAAKIALGLA